MTTEVNGKAEENSEENKQKEEKKDSPALSLNQAVMGGVLGAGIGLLVNPKMTKKVAKTLGESEFVKVAGHEFKKTAQELLAGQAQTSIKQFADGCIHKINEGLLFPKEENEENNRSEKKNEESSHFEKLKEENKNMNERLERIEKMLNDLVEIK